MCHGNVHWSANFDEIQDFALDIVNHFGGTGFLPVGQPPNSSLGTPNALTSTALDQISAYVTSLSSDSLPQSPFRNPDGTLNASANNGAQVFIDTGCQSCHLPNNDFNDSRLGTNVLLHDVGSIRTSSGQRLGKPLNGIDTPTLLSVWETAPYFHDGSARSLADVFMIAGGQVIQAETATLTAGAEVPQWIQYNQDSSSHGEYVRLPGNMTLGQVDGGSGGMGALEIRAIGSDNQTVDVTVNVNGQVHTMSIPPSNIRLDWSPQRIEGIQLSPGATNTISFNYSGNQEVMIDEVIVSTADDLLMASPHRNASNLSPNDFADLLAYLNSLDGSNSVVPSDLIFANGFD